MASLSSMLDDILERSIKYIKHATYGMLRKENEFMNNKEALQALLDGKKIRKKGWKKGEYIYFDTDNNRIRDNDYNRCEFCCEHPNWELYEEHKSILDDEEKAYLSAVIKPFKDRVINISKASYSSFTYGKKAFGITIILKDYMNTTTLPLFSQKSSMYKGMETDKYYTLKELGLDD